MAISISPQWLTIYLYSAHRAVIFAIAQLSCCCRRRQEKKEREGKVHKVTRRYILAICGADTPRPIPIKFGMLVAPRNVINVSNFCNKISGVSDLQGVKIPVFPLTLLVIVTTVLRYRAACDLTVSSIVAV